MYPATFQNLTFEKDFVPEGLESMVQWDNSLKFDAFVLQVVADMCGLLHAWPFDSLLYHFKVVSTISIDLALTEAIKLHHVKDHKILYRNSTLPKKINGDGVFHNFPGQGQQKWVKSINTEKNFDEVEQKSLLTK